MHVAEKIRHLVETFSTQAGCSSLLNRIDRSRECCKSDGSGVGRWCISERDQQIFKRATRSLGASFGLTTTASFTLISEHLKRNDRNSHTFKITYPVTSCWQPSFLYFIFFTLNFFKTIFLAFFFWRTFLLMSLSLVSTRTDTFWYSIAGTS